MPARMAEMARCVQERDFPGFAQLTMKDSNQFHATCLDTFPPISYLSDTSRRVMLLVHRFNAHHGRTKARPGRSCRLPRPAACSLRRLSGPERLHSGPRRVSRPLWTRLLAALSLLASVGVHGPHSALEGVGPEPVGGGRLPSRPRGVSGAKERWEPGPPCRHSRGPRAFQVAYTFDAGPNAVVFALHDTVPEFVAAVRHCFPPESNGDK